MSLDSAGLTLGEAPLSVLVGDAEERVRQLAERLSDRGVLTADDPEVSGLLVDIRTRLLVATSRLELDS
jgi:hypothetical protein